MTMTRRTTLLLLALLPFVAAGCSASNAPPAGVAGAPAAPAAVERFLQLAADRDYAAMGWIFGTGEGPIYQLDPAGQVEQRMYALASLLEHDSFVVGPGSPVPGRTGDALLFNVQMRRGMDSFAVPFTAVRGPDSRWYVEQLDVESLTGL